MWSRWCLRKAVSQAAFVSRRVGGCLLVRHCPEWTSGRYCAIKGRGPEINIVKSVRPKPPGQTVKRLPQKTEVCDAKALAFDKEEIPAQKFGEGLSRRTRPCIVGFARKSVLTSTLACSSPPGQPGRRLPHTVTIPPARPWNKGLSIAAAGGSLEISRFTSSSTSSGRLINLTSPPNLHHA